jgi:hypothetical protein
MDPSGRAVPTAVGAAGQRVKHLEAIVLPFQRRQLFSISDLVLGSVAVDEPDWNGQPGPRRTRPCL